MSLQIFDTCDPSESFPRNGLNLVLAEIPGETEREKHRELFAALKRYVMIKDKPNHEYLFYATEILIH